MLWVLVPIGLLAIGFYSTRSLMERWLEQKAKEWTLGLAIELSISVVIVAVCLFLRDYEKILTAGKLFILYQLIKTIMKSSSLISHYESWRLRYKVLKFVRISIFDILTSSTVLPYFILATGVYFLRAKLVSEIGFWSSLGSFFVSSLHFWEF